MSLAGLWYLLILQRVPGECVDILPYNTLRPRQNGRHFPDDIFKCIFVNENVWTLIKISLKVVPKGPINKIPALVQIMALRRPGDKPLSEPMMVRLLTHIWVTRPQWVKCQFVTKRPIDNESVLVQVMACLAPNRWQAIIWSNVVPVHWRIFAAVGWDMLIFNMLEDIRIF